MSRWVRGTKAPVEREIDVMDGFDVDGVLPPLSGRLVRMSVNPIGEVTPDHHWFEGPGMVHMIELDAGRPARFANRWVRTPEVSNQLREPAVVENAGRWELSNTSVLQVAGSMLAMTETCQPFELDADLATVRRVDFGAGIDRFTAHPHTDPESGEVFGVGYRVDEEASCTLYRIGADGRLMSSHEVGLLGPRSVHDFAMTQNFVILWDLPLELTAEPSQQVKYPFGWNRHGAARIGLLDRADLDAAVRWFEIEPCWVFHPLNAFDTASGVQLDVCKFDRVFDIDRTGPGDPHPPQLWRWELDLASGSVTETLLDERIQEFPRIDAREWGRPHEIGYTVELLNSTGSASLLAHHRSKGAVDVWTSAAGTTLSEAVFVADPDAGPGARFGRDGWLLAIESTPARSDLVVLDATALANGPVGRVRLPQRIPDGFHGDWIATPS